MCFVAFDIEMPAPMRMDASAAAFFCAGFTPKEKPRTLGFAASLLTVAGGFGGSGDDQSGLIQRGERGRGDQRQGGCETEKLGHLLPKTVCLNS
jgi:hypothetical protein